MTNPRDHGHQESPPPVPGTCPRVVRVNMYGAYTCPVCGCKTTCEIEVELIVEQFASKHGWGRYSSCVACEWAGVMNVTEERL